MRRAALSLPLLLAVTGLGCSTIYYAAMARLGWARHDLLAERVQLARDSQEEARRRFADALPLFDAATATGAPPGLEALQRAYDDCADASAAARVAVAAVPPAADAFFSDRQKSLATAGASRARDQQQYEAIRQHGDRLLDAMREADSATTPVLDAMQRQIAALSVGLPAAPPASAAADLLLRTLRLAVALADQYVAELEGLD